MDELLKLRERPSATAEWTPDPWQVAVSVADPTVDAWVRSQVASHKCSPQVQPTCWGVTTSSHPRRPLTQPSVVLSC